MFEKGLKQGYQPKSCNLKNIVPPSVSTNVKPTKEGFDYAKNKMEKRIAKLEVEVVRLRNEGLDNINKYTRFAETDRKTITKLQQACHKWFMRWREAKKDAMNLQKENAELKEEIRLMNEQEARDITSRFPC